jgi:hypothetical protein
MAGAQKGRQERGSRREKKAPSVVVIVLPAAPPPPSAPDGKLSRRGAIWALIIAVLAWIFPDPLKRFLSPSPEKKLVVSTATAFWESVTVTPGPATLRADVGHPTVVIDTRLTPRTGTLQFSGA